MLLCLQLEDDSFVYKATDVLVQATWELPLVVQWPQAVVSYEFSSTPGDISFGIVFVAAPAEGQNIDDLEMETVEEVERVPSHTEVIKGSFELPCEGVVFFLWDNNFDWSAVKKISYSITIQEVSYIAQTTLCTSLYLYLNFFFPLLYSLRSRFPMLSEQSNL